MYSDRIHHAFAFATKHFPEWVSRYDGESCLIRASSVSIILARHGAEETTIVASILKYLLDACPADRRGGLVRDIALKFGPAVGLAVEAAAEPRFDVLGRERPWKACRLEHLARLATAGPAAVDVCVADEMHTTGSALVAIRRLGVEYLDRAGVPCSDDTRWWLRMFGEALRAHPTWRRPPMLGDYQRLADELIRRLSEGTR